MRRALSTEPLGHVGGPLWSEGHRSFDSSGAFRDEEKGTQKKNTNLPYMFTRQKNVKVVGVGAGGDGEGEERTRER